MTRQATVVGAGLAGAACAWALAERGWQVQVLDAAAHPAAGASSLPAGLFGPLESADDNLVSQIVRAGLARALHHAGALLREGEDWALSGALHLKPGTAPRMVRDAGWMRPAALVQAWLRHPRVVFAGGTQVQDVQSLGPADLIVLAAAHDCQGIVQRSLARDPSLAPGLRLPPATQALGGQLSWGPMHAALRPQLPALPVNGQGHLLADIPSPQGPIWLAGAGFEEPAALADLQGLHAGNLARLGTLLPGAALALTGEHEAGRFQAWQGVRCIGRTRLPIVRRLSAPEAPRAVWLCTALGSRGLSWAALCGELLAAAVEGAELPLAATLARQLLGKDSQVERATKPN